MPRKNEMKRKKRKGNEKGTEKENGIRKQRKGTWKTKNGERERERKGKFGKGKKQEKGKEKVRARGKNLKKELIKNA